MCYHAAVGELLASKENQRTLWVHTVAVKTLSGKFLCVCHDSPVGIKEVVISCEKTSQLNDPGWAISPRFYTNGIRRYHVFSFSFWH